MKCDTISQFASASRTIVNAMAVVFPLVGCTVMQRVEQPGRSREASSEVIWQSIRKMPDDICQTAKRNTVTNEVTCERVVSSRTRRASYPPITVIVEPK